MGYGDAMVDLGAPRISPGELAQANRNAQAHKKNAQAWERFANKVKSQAELAIQQRNHFMAEAAERELERDAWVATFSEFRKKYAPDVSKEEIFKSFDRILAEKKSAQN